VELVWKPSLAASCLHGGAALLRKETLLDSEFAEAIAEPTAHLQGVLENLGAPIERCWDCLTALWASGQPPKDAAQAALIRFMPRNPRSEMAVDEIGPLLHQFRRGVIASHPQLEAELETRMGPLKQQWQARGVGLLRSVAEWTDEILIPERGIVVLVYPLLGGYGRSIPWFNTVTLEAMMANPHDALPEAARLAWLIAQLNLNLPALSEEIHPDRLQVVAQLATLPAVLKAAEQVELASLHPRIVELALQAWRIDTPPGVDAVDLIFRWWETYLEGRPPWRVALTALDQMLAMAEQENQ